MGCEADAEERSKFNLGRQGETWFLTEDGLYEVLMQSRKPQAKQFKKGVKEILKSIRRTGCYSVTNVIKDRVEAGMMWVEGCKRILNLSDSSTLALMQKKPDKASRSSISSRLSRPKVSRMERIKFLQRTRVRLSHDGMMISLRSC